MIEVPGSTIVLVQKNSFIPPMGQFSRFIRLQLIPKPGTNPPEMRFCLDCRKVNSLMKRHWKREIFPMGGMNEFFSQIFGVTCIGENVTFPPAFPPNCEIYCSPATGVAGPSAVGLPVPLIFIPWFDCWFSNCLSPSLCPLLSHCQPICSVEPQYLHLLGSGHCAAPWSGDPQL